MKQLPRKTQIATIVAMLVGLLAVVSFAGNMHFKGPVTLTDNGTYLTVTGQLAGLGNAPVTITLEATGFGSTVCTNKGGNNPPGQKQPNVNVSGQEVIPNIDKNGTVSFTLNTNPPDNPTPEEAGCPNGNFSASFTDITFTSARVTCEQSGVVITKDFSL